MYPLPQFLSEHCNNRCEPNRMIIHLNLFYSTTSHFWETKKPNKSRRTKLHTPEKATRTIKTHSTHT